MQLVNIYCPSEVRVWFSMHPDHFREDLCLRERGRDRIGTPPEWFTDDPIGRCEEVLDLYGSFRSVDSGEGWVFTERSTLWALEHGIAPGQPFLVRISEPQWSQDYYGS